MITIFILQLITLIILFISIYLVLVGIREKSIDKRIKKGLNELNAKQLEKDIKDMQFISKKKKIKYFSNLSLLIEQSNIKSKFKFINPLVVIIISLLIAFGFFSIAQKYITILPSSILIAVIGYKLPSLTLNILVAINSDKITKKLIDFINLLKNFCMIKNEIVFAVSSSADYLKDPLKSICSTFNYEVKHGTNPYDALENMKRKIDNNQYKLLIKNLQICSKHSNEYLKVLRNSEKLILRFSKEQTIRKKEIKRGVLGILMLTGLSIIIFSLLAYINPFLFNLLKTSSIGRGIVIFNTFAYLVAICVSEKLSRFDF